MFLSGTLLNAATVLAGGLLGTFLGDRLPAGLRDALIRAIGLFTLAMGAKFALETSELLVMLASILVGGAIGTALALDARLTAFGDMLERRFAGKAGAARGVSDLPPPAATGPAPAPTATQLAKRSTVSEAFVTAAIIFCVGPLTFLGSIQNGLTGDATLLTIKSMLDGITAVALAATLGWGVLLTVGLILVYQGGLAAGAALFAGLLSDLQLREMNAVGGLLILGVGLRLLRIRDVAVADFLPAIVVAPFVVTLAALIRPLGEAFAR
ncbi:MAG: DUF554 domain-containing protein [Candidatus Limnocylindria bacterium]